MSLWGSAAVSFVTGSIATQDFATQELTHTVLYTPPATGRLFLGLTRDNADSNLTGTPAGFTTHLLDSLGGTSPTTARMNVLSIEITGGMVGVEQSWEFTFDSSRRATAIMLMLDGVAASSFVGGTVTDASATNRTTVGGGTLTVGASGSAIVAFVGAYGYLTAISVTTANSFTQAALVNATTNYQPDAYGGYRLSVPTGSVAIPEITANSATGMVAYGMEVKAA